MDLVMTSRKPKSNVGLLLARESNYSASYGAETLMLVILSISVFMATLLVVKRINGTGRQERLAVVFGSISFAILSVIVSMIVLKIEPMVWFLPFIVVFMVLNAIAGLSMGAVSLRHQTNDRKQALLGMSLSAFSLISPGLLFVLRVPR